MDKFNELKEQVESELYWVIESIKDQGIEISHDIDLFGFLKIQDKLDEFDRGILFGYLSILTKAKFLENEESN